MSDLDARIAAAEAYHAHLVGPVFRPWAEKAVAMAAPRPGESVLDAACGAGVGAALSMAALSPGGRIVSLDVDSGMVAVAQRVAAQAGPPADVTLEWLVADAMEVPLPDDSVDLVLCLQGPQFMPEPARALAEFRRVLKPGGRLAASMWSVISDNKGHYALAQALETRGVKPALKPFSLGDPAAARAALEGAGFTLDAFRTEEVIARYPSVEAFVNGVAAGAPATRHALAQLSAEDRAGFLSDVQATLAPYVDEAGPALPTRAHLALAHI